MNKDRRIDLTEGPILKMLLAFSMPIMLSNLLQSTYNIVDMIIVGQYLGKNGLSAVSIGTDVIHIINLGTNGLCSGAQIMIAQYTGAKNDKAVSKSIGTMFSVCLMLSLSVTLLMLLLTDSFLHFLNTDPAIYRDAKAYTIVCILGITLNFGYGLIGAFLRGKGDSHHPLIFVVIADVINIFLDLLFVATFRMGAFGAALATVLSQAVSFLWGISFLYRNREWFGFDFQRESFRPEKEYAAVFFKLGLPMCLQSVTVSLAAMVVNSYIYAYGVVVVAVTGIGNKIATLTQIITNSILRGGAAVIGQNIAAGKMDRVRSVMRYNMAIGVSYAIFLSTMTLLFSRQLFGIFTRDPEVLDMARIYVPVIIIKFFAFGSRGAVMALINGIGRPKFNIVIGLLDGLIVRIGLSMLMGIVMGMGLRGFWLGNACAGFTALIIGGIYYLSGKWETAKLLTQEAKTE